MILPEAIWIVRRTEKYLDLTRLIFAVFITVSALSIGYGQTIRGNVTDADNGRPVANVLIALYPDSVYVRTDSTGSYIFENEDPGRHIIRFRHIQYSPVFREVQLSAATEAVINVEMELSPVMLPEATVTAETFTLPGFLYQITAEETERYPGTFFDPARFANSFPGVQIVNDQANQLVINGMSPDLMQWHLEGVEIINPNHLANAGTLGDRPTGTGGGVNMLSNLVLDRSSLLLGPEPGVSNATSALMDMRFRDGNTEQYEHSVQVGLLGIQGKTEGPFRKGGKSSFVLHGRYSTVGLLSAIGVDFGDEKINFGDISLNTRFAIGEKGAELKVFGLYGANSNKFEAKDQEEWEADKDRRNIDYSAGTELIGASYNQPIASSGLLSITTVYSRSTYERTDQFSTSDTLFSSDDGEFGKWASHIRYSTQLGDKYLLGIGVRATQDNVFLDRVGEDGSYQADGTNLLFRPNFDIKTSFGSFDLRFGAAYAYYDNSGEWFFEPEAEVNVHINPKNELTFSYRLGSQALNGLIYTDTLGEAGRNKNLLPLRSHNLMLKYQAALGEGIIEGSVVYSRLFEVPGTVLPSDFSPLNLNAHPAGGRLANIGEGDALALNVGYRKNFTRKYFITANASAITSEYRGSDEVDRSTSYDVGYGLFLSGGKESQRERR